MAYASSVIGPSKRIVITGGPGAGKTAVLELARRDLCKHVEILPEAARIVFGGGFPRRVDDVGRRGAQRAIFHVQDELERMGAQSSIAATLPCDRGTLDGLAYWPGSWDEYFRELATTMQAELARYAVVIHLRVPDLLRIEGSAAELTIKAARPAWTRKTCVDPRTLRSRRLIRRSSLTDSIPGREARALLRTAP